MILSNKMNKFLYFHALWKWGAEVWTYDKMVVEHSEPRPWFLDKENDNFGFNKAPACFENEISVVEYGSD